MTAGPEEKRKKEGRIARQLRIAREVRDEPGTAVTLIRDWFTRLWAARGGGLYGLGVVVSFLVLEARTIAGDFAASSGVVDFVGGEILEFVFRLGFMSFLNGMLALLWPLYLLERFEFWGIALLAAAYLLFEYVLRPVVESRLPELAEARSEMAERKRRKREKKEQKKAEKARRRAGKRSEGRR